MDRITANRIGRFCLAAFFSALWVLPATLHAQTEDDALRFSQRFPATGARMMGMAGAGIAGVADWSAVFTNPAGLGWLSQSQVNGSLGIFSTTDDASFTVPGMSPTFDDIRDSRTRFSNVAYAFRAPTLRGSLVVGVGYNQTHAFDRLLVFQGNNNVNSVTDFFMPLPDEFDIEETEDGFDVAFSRALSRIAFNAFAIDFNADLYDDGEAIPFLPAVTTLGTIAQSGEVFETGQMGELSFGGAFEAAKGTMVGLSANIVFGTYEYEQVFQEDDFQNDNDGTNYPAGGLDFLDFRQTLESDLLGINFRAGLSAKVAPSVRFGVTAETPTFFTVQELFGTQIETTFDDGGVESDQEEGEFEYEITTPWRLGAGVAYEAQGLLVSADLEYVDWSQMSMDSDLDPLLFDDVNRRIRRDLRSVVNGRVGAEYRMGNIAFRGGFAVQPDARDDQDDAVDRGRTYFSGGLGYIMGNQFELNLGWMQERFEDTYLPYAEVTDAPLVTEDVRRNWITFGVKVMLPGGRRR